MTSVNVTTTKNTVTVSEGDTRIVTIKTQGPQGPAFSDGDKGDVTVSSNGTAISINNSAVTSAKIADGAIVNADINASAAIALSKLATGALPTAITVTSANISDLSIVDADISGSAAISLSKLATGALPTAITVTSANISDLSIVNADINASAGIQGTKISANFGSQSIISSLDGNQVTQGNAALTLTHATNSNLRANHLIVDDFPSGSGTYFIQATESGVSNDRNMCLQGYGGKLKIGSNSVAPTELLDVAGNIAVSGTVDGRDVAADGTKLDGIETGATADQTASEIKTAYESNSDTNAFTDADHTKLDGIETAATADQTAAEILTLIKTVDGAGSGLDADTLDGISSASFLRSDTNATFSGSTLTVNATLLLSDSIRIGDDAFIEDYNAANSVRIKGNQDTNKGFIAFGQQTKKLGVDGASAALTYDGNTVIDSAYTGALANGITATTQSASDNSTKVATTAYTDTAISNLVNSAPSTLDTLKELSDALGSDPNFATTVTNSIATKLPLAGGTLTGNLTISNNSPRINFTDGNNNDFAIIVDGNDLNIQDTTAGENRLNINSSGVVSCNDGLSVTGTITSTSSISVPDAVSIFLGTGNDLSLKHDGSSSLIRNNTGELVISCGGSGNASPVKIQPNQGEEGIVAHHNEKVELYFDNSKKLQTQSIGITVTGQVECDELDMADSTGVGNNRIKLGTGDDLQLYHDGTHSYLDNATGNLHIRGNGADDVKIQAKNGEQSIICHHDGAVELYFDNVKRLETTSNGVIVSNSITGVDYRSPSSSTLFLTSGLDWRFRSTSGTERARIDTGGRLLVGTSAARSPAAINTQLQVEGTNANTSSMSLTRNSADNSSSRLIFNKSRGTAIGSEVIVQDEDGLGLIDFVGNDGGSFGDVAARISAFVDGTPGSDDMPGRLVFSTTADGANSPTDRLTIDSAGLVKVPDNGKFVAGASNDLQIYHDGSNSAIQNSTGILYLYGGSDNIRIRPENGEDSIIAKPNERVELYYDNSKKFETISTGAVVTGNLGLNTTSPASTIDARAASGATITARNTGTAASISMNVGSSANILISRGVNSSTARDLIFMQGTTTAAKIDTNNNFLITNDNAMLQFGAGQDLKIAHTGSESYIQNSTGALQLQADDIKLFDHSTAHLYFRGQTNSSVELYFDNSKKLETTSYGVAFVAEAKFDNNTNAGKDVVWDPANDQMRWLDNTKATFGTGSDLNIRHDGVRSVIENSTGILKIISVGDKIDLCDGNFNTYHARLNSGNSVELYFNNSKKFETKSNGVEITGNVDISGLLSIDDSQKAVFGNSHDLEIEHDGSHSNIHNTGTGNLHIRGNGTDQIKLQAKSGEQSIVCSSDGGVELYYDNSLKLNTTSTGTTTTGQSKVRTVTAQNSATEYNGQDFGYLVTFDGGSDTNDEGNGICFAQQYYDQDGSTVRTGAIVGYKSVGNGSFGGGLQFKVQQSGATPLKVALKMDHQGHLYMPHDNQFLKIGAGQDLQLYHDGNDSIITNGIGNLILRNTSGDAGVIGLQPKSGENAIICRDDNNVELYYDNNKKLETTSDGVDVTGELDVAGDFRMSTTRGISLDIQEGVNGSRTSVTLTFTSAYNGKTVFVEMFVGSSNYHLHHVSHRYHNGGLNVLTNDGTGCTVTSSISGTSNSSTYTYTVTFDAATSHPYARFIVSLGGYLISSLTSPSISFAT